MRNFYIFALVVGACLLSSNVYAATFPIIQNFSGAQPSDWELRSNAVWGVSVVGDNVLRLTTASTSQTGLGFYNDSFASNLGIVAEFRYYAGGGTGADGFAFFLVDGDLVDENNIAAGALGGALGYAQSTLTPSDGIPHAYLGVGFDEFGNFVTDSGGMDPGSGSPIPDSVVLRGEGNGVTGYDYLTHRAVFTDFGERIDGGWRIARVSVLPGTGNATIRVEMSWDEGDTWETVIDDYVYSVAPPTNLKLGFTGGTGGSTNIHAIGNLEVILPVDLETVLTAAPTSTYERGDAFTYTYTVTNNSVNDSASTTITNTIPVGALGIDDLSWSLTSTHGSSSAGDADDIDAITTSIPSGETVTVVVSGTVGDNILNTTDLDHTITAVPEATVKDPSPSDAVVAVNVTTDAPTAAESALLKLLAYAASNGASSTPTLGDYTTAGITGVTSGNLAAVNTALAASDASSEEEVQAVVDEQNTPEVLTTAATSISGESATLNANFTRAGNKTIEALGFIYGLTTSYGATTSSSGATPQTYAASLVGLTCGTTYYFKAFVEDDNDDVWYGANQSFTTTACSSGGSATRNRVVSAAVVPGTPIAGGVGDVAVLEARVAALRQQLAQMQGGGSGTTTVRDLYLEMEGDDVRSLQVLLIAQDTGPAAKELARVTATGYFGRYTKNALGEYQLANGVDPHIGYFGAITRTQMKAAGLSGLWW